MVLPVLVPLLVMSIEPTRALRRRIMPFIILGAVVGLFFLVTMLETHPTVQLGSYHLAYSLGITYGIPVVGAYIVATCGPMLISKQRHVFWFGVANLVAVVVLARLCASGFTSLWCLYATLASAAIALYLRLSSSGKAAQTSRSATLA